MTSSNESGMDGSTLSRRDLLVRGVLATSAIVLAACGGSSASSSSGSTSGELSDATFDLTIDPSRAIMVSGTVANQAAGSGPVRGVSTIKGSLVGLKVLAHLSQDDQVRTGSGYLTTTHLDTTVGSLGSSLVGEFSLNPDYTLRSGAISGGANGRGAAVGVDPASGDRVTINGMYGTTKVALVAGVPTGDPYSVTGTVADRRVHFDIVPGHVDGTSGFPRQRVTGTYSGPADLLALIIGSIAYFGS